MIYTISDLLEKLVEWEINDPANPRIKETVEELVAFSAYTYRDKDGNIVKKKPVVDEAIEYLKNCEPTEFQFEVSYVFTSPARFVTHESYRIACSHVALVVLALVASNHMVRSIARTTIKHHLNGSAITRLTAVTTVMSEGSQDRLLQVLRGKYADETQYHSLSIIAQGFVRNTIIANPQIANVLIPLIQNLNA